MIMNKLIIFLTLICILSSCKQSSYVNNTYGLVVQGVNKYNSELCLYNIKYYVGVDKTYYNKLYILDECNKFAIGDTIYFKK